MSKLLWVYLVTTGVLASVALAVPGLVTLGFFFFVLPGYTLFFAPTAFLWGSIFAIAYLPTTKLVRHHIAALIVLPITALVLWAIPEPSMRLAAETLSQYHLAEVLPAAPIQPHGDIRIDQPYPNWDNINQEKLGFRPYSCDDRCLALLFEPGVRSVTVTVTNAPTYEAIRDGESRIDDASLTYRLLPKIQCGERALDPDLEHRRGHFGRTRGDNAAMAAEWGLKLTEEYCLIGDTPLNRFDVLIRTGTWRQKTAEEAEPSPWSLRNHDTVAKYQEIRSGDGAILFRRFELVTQALSAPLSIEGKFAGGGDLSMHFGWWTQTLPTMATPVDGNAPAAIDSALAVQRTFDPKDGLAAAREALRAALANPSAVTGEAMSPLIGKYMEVLETAGSEPEDLVLLADLLADPRVHDLPKAWVLPRKLSAAQLSDLLPAAVHMLATAPESAGPESSDLGERLGEWPHAAFANPSPEMRRLLADPIRRRRATGLIARLSDMGASGAPIVADIMAWHAAAVAQLKLDDSTPLHEREDEFDAHFAVIDAGRIAMCRLGPVAASQLPQMLVIELSISLRGFERRDWDRMTLRLGRPLTEIHTPLSGTDEHYRESLAHWLARFDIEKSCA